VAVAVAALAYGGWLQVLPAPGHVGAASEAWCSGGSCRGLYNPVYIGPACIDVNVWGGLEWAASGGARVAVEFGGVLRAASRWRLAAVPSHGILAYHEVIYGAKPWGSPVCQDESFLALPAEVGTLPRIVLAFNYTVVKATPINVAIDAWLFKDGNRRRGPQPGDVEVMVEVRADFGEDCAKIGEVAAPVLVNGWIRYVVFDVILYELGWTLIKFKAREELGGVVAVDFTYFVDRAKEVLRSRGWSRGGTTADAVDGLYLMSLELGTEVYAGAMVQTEVDVEWYIHRYHIHTEPRGVPTEQALLSAYGAVVQAAAHATAAESSAAAEAAGVAPPAPRIPFNTLLEMRVSDIYLSILYLRCTCAVYGVAFNSLFEMPVGFHDMADPVVLSILYLRCFTHRGWITSLAYSSIFQYSM
jgi:hypothetical protein